MQKFRRLMGKHIVNINLAPEALQGGVQKDTEGKDGL